MPRTTKLTSCEKCRAKEVHFGVVTGYYVLGSALKRSPAGNHTKQVKGSLRTYGLCLGCFMSFALSMGIDAAKAKELRLQLQPPTKARTRSRK
jgi:hypothetical protein